MVRTCEKRTQERFIVFTILAILALSPGTPVNGKSVAQVQFANWNDWSAFMSHTPLPQAGCYVVTHPGAVWEPTQCLTAPSEPLSPSQPSPVGPANDYTASSSCCTSPLIGSSTGYFTSISGLTSEQADGSLRGPNVYTLQDNSNCCFTTSTPYTEGRQAHGWQQFVFSNSPLQGSTIYIEYWLVGYHTKYNSCPKTLNGISWNPYPLVSPVDCWANSHATSTPNEAVSNLGNLILRAVVNHNSNDEVTLCIREGACYLSSMTSHVLDLYRNWVHAEFNVFGYAGSQANFNSGTSINVLNTLNDQKGNPITPSCINESYTAETSNLHLGSCSSGSNGVSFTESNAHGGGLCGSPDGSLYPPPACAVSPSGVLVSHALLTLSGAQNLTVQPGQSISFNLGYTIWHGSNSTEIDQLMLIPSWTPSWPPPSEYYYGIYSNMPPDLPALIGSTTLHLIAPSAPGNYYLWFVWDAKSGFSQAAQDFRTKPNTPAVVKILVTEHSSCGLILGGRYSLPACVVAPKVLVSSDATCISPLTIDGLSWSYTSVNSGSFQGDPKCGVGDPTGTGVGAGAFFLDTPASEATVQRSFVVPTASPIFTIWVWGQYQPVNVTVTIIYGNTQEVVLTTFSPNLTQQGWPQDSVRVYSLSQWAGETIIIRIDQSSTGGMGTLAHYTYLNVFSDT